LRILVVRTSAMGDVVHCLPVLSALKRRLPGATIAWVIEKAFAPLLEEHPDVDRLITVRLRPWRRRPLSAEVRRDVAAAIAELRSFRPDAALDLMGNHKGGLLALASGARRRFGASASHRRETSSAVWINRPVAVRGRHAVDRALEIAAAVDGDGEADAGAVDFGADKILRRVPPEARTFLDQRAAPFVLIQAGAGWGNKSYPAPWWGRVAHQLRRRAGVEVWVPVAPGEEHLARAVVAASGGAARAVDAAPLPFLAALLRHSSLVLGGDTGPIHLAHAFGTPVLCLIGPTDPARNGPYALGGGAASEAVLWHRLPCSNCYRRFAEPKACLLGIPPGEVVEKALGLLV